MTFTRILNTALFILCTNCIIAQTIHKTEYTFDINQKINNVDYYYYFNKGKNDTFINLKIMTFSDSNKTLCAEVAPLATFYNIAKKEIKIDLWNMNIGYPLQYDDVLANQINFFVKDTAWQNYFNSYKNNLKNKNNNLDYELIAKKMKEAKVYKCLEVELNKIGYTINEIGIEKVGFLDLKYFPKMKSKLFKQFPYTESQFKTVPMPYMVYIGISTLK
jgi:hypothetical protein